MKVLSYLQLGNLPEKEYLDYLTYDIFRTYKKNCQDKGIEASLAKFMTQPFKPEIIKELFKEIPSYENTFVVSTEEYPYKPGNEFDITIKETPYDFIRGKFINVR